MPRMLELGHEFYPFKEEIEVDNETGGISSPEFQLEGYGVVTADLTKMEPRGLEYSSDEPQWVVSIDGAVLLVGSAYSFSVLVGENPNQPLDEPLACMAVVGGRAFISGGGGTGLFEEWMPVGGGQRGEMIVSADETLLESIRVKLQ